MHWPRINAQQLNVSQSDAKTVANVEEPSGAANNAHLRGQLKRHFSDGRTEENDDDDDGVAARCLEWR